MGCLLWGLMTASFGFCSSVSQGIFFWGMNGIGTPSYQNAQTLKHSDRLGLCPDLSKPDTMLTPLLQAWRL